MFLPPVAVRQIDALVDPLGVLSVYLSSHQPGDRPGLSQAVRVGSRLQALSRDPHASSAPERAAALRACLKRVRPSLTRLVTRRGGRGRALYVRLSGDDVWELETAMPLRTTVALEPTGYVRPLVAALDDGLPAGVVIAGRRRARLLDWRMGLLADVGAAPIAHRGAASALAEQVVAIARERDWRLLLVDGDPRLAGALLCIEPPLRGCHLSVSRTPLGQLSRPALDLAVSAELGAARRRLELALVSHAVSESDRGRGAVLGMRATAQALTAGRLSHLLFDDERDRLRWPGRGLVEAGLPIDPAERLIELALDAAAAITPVEGRAARSLQGAGGVAALLRW
ncbi:MAG: hypothetical protein ACXVY5_02985 [Gaiellales bacterium]